MNRSLIPQIVFPRTWDADTAQLQQKIEQLLKEVEEWNQKHIVPLDQNERI